MAWSSGNMTATAGELKTILDALLPVNAYWSIYDDIGGNVTVYENNDVARNSTFYVYVDDSNAGYSIIQLWEGWNAVGHAGTGQSLTLASGGARTLRFIKGLGAYYLSVKDHRFIYVSRELQAANYCGQLSRYDTAKNMPVLISATSGSTTTQLHNPLGHRNNDIGTAAATSWRCLFDEAGDVRTIIPLGESSVVESSAVTNSLLYNRAISEERRIVETPIWNWQTKLLMGELDGVCYIGDQASGDYSMANEETCEVDGQNWIMIAGSTKGYSIIEMA